MNEQVFKNVIASLTMMWKGMAGLFIVCGGIAILMMIITKFVNVKKR
jgi:hypothetical protein